MTLSEFKENMIGILEKITDEQEIIRAHEARKNNGVIWQGVSISERGKRIARVQYLEPFYRKYQEGADPDTLAQEILRISRELPDEKVPDLSFMNDPEKLRDALQIQMVEEETNEELLKRVPHKPFLDLQMVCRCCMEIGGEKGSMLVENSHLEMMGITEEQLWEYALADKENTEPVMIPIHSILGHLLGEDKNSIIPGENREMFVLTTREGGYGASCIANPDFMRRVAEVYERDYYVLPSSVHECISIPAEDPWDDMEIIGADRLLDMVVEINETIVDETEVLADSVYRYYYDQNRLDLVSHQCRI